VARDLQYGPLHASRGRTVYMPEVGQRAYAIPKDWHENPDERLDLNITFKKKEWISMLMLPSASSINNSGHFTKEFRQALIQVIYDAFRFKLKPLVIQAAQQAVRRENQGTSDEDQEETPGPSAVIPRSKRALKAGQSVPATRVDPTNTALAGLKMLDLMAPGKEPGEDKIQYLK